MADSFIGEIRMFAGNFAPLDWAFCDGSLQAIAENEALFSLIGTTYGGDGQTTYALPDLRGRFPIHQGTGPGLPSVVIGEQSGTETVALLTQQLPSHTHTPVANGAAGESPQPGGKTWGAYTDGMQYTSGPTNAPMAANALSSVGGGQPHENMPPFLGMNFIICLYGIYPPRA